MLSCLIKIENSFMAIKYKISDEELKLREYGRNVQMMVDYAKSLKNDVERNVLCREIVRIMGNINPGLKDSPDYLQKLWDHFYHLAEYDIDIDSEYSIPDQPTLFSKAPSRMPYLSGRSRFRQYGRNIELMAEKAMEMNDMDRRHALVTMILNIMKMHLKGQEKDSNAEIIVCDHLRILSKGGLDFQPEEIEFYKFNALAIQPMLGGGHSNQNPPRQGGGKKGKGKKGNHNKRKR